MYFLLLLKKSSSYFISLKTIKHTVPFFTNKLCKLLLLLQMPALHFILIFKIFIEHLERKKAESRNKREKLKH